MKKTIFILTICANLVACGGSNNSQNANPPNENGNELITAPTLPNSPKPKPEPTFDAQLLIDIEEFVKLAHAVQYFYPSTQSRDSHWPLFIAESIIELSQTPTANRADKGIELIRQIAPYLVNQQRLLPAVNDATEVSTWRQNAPISQRTYSRNLRTQNYRDLSNQNYVAQSLFTPLAYYQQTLFLPLYLPTNLEHSGQTFQQLGRWQLSQDFQNTEICMASVSSMWAAIEHFWPYFSQVAVNWPQSLPLLLQACTEQDFNTRRTKIYTEFGKLKDNHISIALPTPEQYIANKYVPFLYELVENRAIIVRVEENQQNGIEIGDEVLSINNRDIQSYLADKALSNLKNDLHRQKIAAMTDVLRDSGDTILYQIKKPTGEIFDMEITPKPLSELTKFYGLRYVPFREQAVEVLDDGLYRINVYNVSNAEAANIRNQIQNAHGVVLDMRRYPQDWHGWQTVLSWFIQNTAINDTLAYTWQGAPNQSDRKHQGISQTIQPAGNGLDIPVVVLASRDSQSQNEHSLIFARSGGLTIMGEPTSGINGEILQLDYFGGFNQNSSQGITFIYTNMQANRLNGDPLINKGIQPDILVPRTVQSVIDQEDNQLSSAIEYLKQQISKSP